MRRSPLLVSAILHLLVVSLMLSVPLEAPTRRTAAQPVPPEPRRTVVFMPPRRTLRDLALVERPPVPETKGRGEILLLPQPAPLPTPSPEAKPRDRVSLGGPSPRRLLSDRSWAKPQGSTLEPRGSEQPDPRGSVTIPPADPRVAKGQLPRTEEPPRGDGLAVGPKEPTMPWVGGRPPTGAGRGGVTGAEGVPRQRVTAEPGWPGGSEGAPSGPSIAESLRSLDRGTQAGRTPLGTPDAIGRQMGSLFFDPQGADFTPWVSHFTNELYRNWVVPQSALFGYARGHVTFVFTVERDGRVSLVQMTESSKTQALDRAAHNALSSSRLLSLPADFDPPRLTIQVTFYYNEESKGE